MIAKAGYMPVYDPKRGSKEAQAFYTVLMEPRVKTIVLA